MKKYISSLAALMATLLIGICPGFSQSDDLLIQNFFFDTRAGFSNMSLPSAISRVGGNAATAKFYFLQDDWKESLILSRKGEKAQVDARYDIRNDQVLLQLEDGLASLLPEVTRVIALGNTLFVPEGYEAKGGKELKVGWFELLANGPVRLLKRYELDQRKADMSPGRLNDPTNVKWVVVSDIYVKEPKLPAREQKLGKKKILKLFGRQAYQVERYASKNHLGFRKEDDLAALFIYYAELEGFEGTAE